MNNKNSFSRVHKLSYQILTCVTRFLWKERIHSHSFDCIKNFIQRVLWSLNKNVYFDPKHLFMYKIHYYVLYNKRYEIFDFSLCGI